MTIELSESEYVIDAIADAVVKKMKDPSYNSIKTELEPCDDAISRQDLREPRFIIAENDYQKGWNDALDSVYENAPSVQPQPKMGRWIMSDDGLYRPICNNCGAHPWKGYIPTVEEATEAFKYCPNCGAKMSEIPAGAEGSDKE